MSPMNPLPDYAEALQLAVHGIEALDRFESVELSIAAGRVLAEPINADRDLPPFNRAMMDGYAIRAAEFAKGKSWPVAFTIAAGSSPDVRVPQGQCVAIATGAALPSDLDTVIQHELSDRGDHHGKPVQFTIESITKGNAVHPRGADAKAGDILIPSGTTLAAHHLGIVAAVGKMNVSVMAKPRAVILTSGDEVVPPETPQRSVLTHQIRNSNSPMITELLRRIGASPIRSNHVLDHREATIAALRQAIEESDLVLTIGGVSVGERDHFPAAYDANGVQRSLQGASIQPGRPVVVGRSPNGAIVVGLPGNPVSALACACLFVWPIVRRMLGLEPDLPWREVILAEPVKPNATRRAFRPAILQTDGRAVVPSWAGSGDLAHTSPTHGLIELPVQTELVPAGTPLRFLPWP